MKKSDRTFILGVIFLLTMAIAYVAVEVFHINVLRYYPLEHAWKWDKLVSKNVVAQGWYGHQLFAYSIALPVTLVVYIVLSLVAKTKTSSDSNYDQHDRTQDSASFILKPVHYKLMGFLVTTVMLFCMGYMMYCEYHEWGII